MGRPPIKLKEKNKMVITTIITITGIILVGYLFRKLYLLNREIRTANYKVKLLQYEYRSALVRFGKTFGQFAPFTKDFTEEEKNGFIFLGCPIDGVIFGQDKIKFVEIKTGKSQLSGKQKRIRKMVENGKVEFKEVRY